MKRYLIITICTVFSVWLMEAMPFYAFSQKTIKQQDGIYMIANGNGNGIQLRWSPTSPVLWQLANKYGYVLTKYTVSKDGRLLSKPLTPEILSSPSIKPASPDLMKALAQKDTMIEAMSSLIYENNGEPASTPQAIIANRNLLNQKFSYALLIADINYNAAMAAGLGFTDTHVKQGEHYIYKISINLPKEWEKNISYKPATVFCSPDEHWMNPVIETPGLQIINNRVTLQWKIEHLSGFYTAYEIERSDDGINYYPATDLPFVQMTKANKNPSVATFIDSVNQPNSDSVYYRVRGITPFAERGNFSKPAAQRNFIISEYRPKIDSIKNLNNGQVRLYWRLPDSMIDKIETLSLYVSNNPNNAFFPVAGSILPQDNGYTDSIRYVNNYYKLGMTYKGNHKTFTSLPRLFQGEDSIPPAKPVLSNAVIDSLGSVTLTWKANTEKDLLGYRIYRANSLKEEFTEITHHAITDTVWKDTVTLHTLTPHVYYTILAMDRYYNASKYSDTVMLRRPDTIAPSAALIATTVLKDDSIMLTMIPGSSEDVMMYKLNRIDIQKEKDTIQLVTIHPSSDTLLFYTDTTAIVGNTYQYILYTYDSSNNKSVNISGLIACEPGYRKAVDSFTTSLDRDKKQIQLSWAYSLQGVDKFIVYRSKNGSVFTTLTTLTATERKYTDKDLNINNTYRYKIKAVFKNGKHSLMSKENEIMY